MSQYRDITQDTIHYLVQRSMQAQRAPPLRRPKPVCCLHCRHCTSQLCSRGMKAILLADAGIELYSTDAPPMGVSLVNDHYTTQKCACKIRDAACLTCGNVIGYHVVQPCKACLESCNNGHFWMFHMENVRCSDRFDPYTMKPVQWSTLPAPDMDIILERQSEDRYSARLCR